MPLPKARCCCCHRQHGVGGAEQQQVRACSHRGARATQACCEREGSGRAQSTGWLEGGRLGLRGLQQQQQQTGAGAGRGGVGVPRLPQLGAVAVAEAG